jgi:hypothetical protein
MSFTLLDTVVLTHDLPAHGLRSGDLGAIVFVHSPAQFEVEFVRASGGTQALLTLSEADLRRVADADLLTVRPVSVSREA